LFDNFQAPTRFSKIDPDDFSSAGSEYDHLVEEKIFNRFSIHAKDTVNINLPKALGIALVITGIFSTHLCSFSIQSFLEPFLI
jgi:hypothetical protein